MGPLTPWRRYVIALDDGHYSCEAGAWLAAGHAWCIVRMPFHEPAEHQYVLIATAALRAIDRYLPENVLRAFSWIFVLPDGNAVAKDLDPALEAACWLPHHNTPTSISVFATPRPIALPAWWPPTEIRHCLVPRDAEAAH